MAPSRLTTTDDLPRIREALAERARELVAHILSTAPNRALSTRREARFGAKGAFSLVVSGPKKGLWRDHETGEGGDLLELIRLRETRGNFAAALRWARDWLGWTEGETPDPTKAEQRRREREAKRAAQEAEAAREEAAAIEDARRIWRDAGPIEGTPGEVYLRQARAIPARHWPEAIGWSKRERAVIFAITDAAGDLVAVQRVRVTRKGEKDETRGPAKLSRGPVARGAIHLHGPAAGPVLICEGPETGLSLWAATGFATLILAGGLARAVEIAPRGRQIILARDDDPRTSTAAKSANAAFRQLQAAGFDVREAWPWAERREDKSDFNDALKAGGFAAVRERVDLVNRAAVAVPQIFPTADAGRAQLREAMAAHYERADEWAKAAQEPRSRKAYAEMPAPPKAAMKSDTGSGKTNIATEFEIAATEKRRARGDQSASVHAVPSHELGRDALQRKRAAIEAAGVNQTAAIFYGRGAISPVSGEPMCRNKDDAEAAEKLHVSVKDEICPTCPFRQGCEYLAQNDLDADHWIIAHDFLFGGRKLPKPIRSRGVASILLDEAFYKRAIVHGRAIAIDALTDPTLPEAKEGAEAGRLASIRAAIAAALRGNGPGPLRREFLTAQGITADSARYAAKAEWLRKLDKKTEPDWRLRDANASIGPFVALYHAIDRLLSSKSDKPSGNIKVTTDKETGALCFRVSSKLEILASDHLKAPVLHIDATLEMEIVRHFIPDMPLVADIRIGAPNQTVVWDQTNASKTYLDPAYKDTPTKQKKRATMAAKANAWQRQHGGEWLFVTNKEIVKTLDLAPAFSRGWFNNLAGVDKFKNVSGIVVAGLSNPPSQAVEEDAAAITGEYIEPQNGYPPADTTFAVRTKNGIEQRPTQAPHHPHPVAEAFRRSAAQGELIQAIGRGRGVNRTADNPLVVYVIGRDPPPLPVDAIITAEEAKPSPFDLMLDAGAIAFEGAEAAWTAYRHMWKTPGAARFAFHAAKAEPPAGAVAVIFQREGNGQRPQRAWIDPARVFDPRAEIEARLGPLTRVEIIVPEPVAEPAVIEQPAAAVGAPAPILIPAAAPDHRAPPRSPLPYVATLPRHPPGTWRTPRPKEPPS